MLKVTQFNEDRLQKYEAHDGHYTTWEAVEFDFPACIAAFTEKRSEADLSAAWQFWNDEVWYLFQGRLQLQWSNPPMFNDHEDAIVEAGDLIFVEKGTKVTATVLGSDTVRFLWVAMPRPRHFGAGEFWGTKSGS